MQGGLGFGVWVVWGQGLGLQGFGVQAAEPSRFCGGSCEPCRPLNPITLNPIHSPACVVEAPSLPAFLSAWLLCCCCLWVSSMQIGEGSNVFVC